MYILVVDDDPEIVELVSIHLKDAGYRVKTAKNGIEALTFAERETPDLAIVDVMMPEMDGYTLTRHLREEWNIPVLLLTARGELEDKERGFLAGTDDYVTKPFEPRELLFRVQALLRRYDKRGDSKVVAGPLQIDTDRYEVRIHEKLFILPLKEFELLATLASRPNHVWSRDLLIENVWGYDYEGDEQTLNVHIKRLRDKLAPYKNELQITTVRGVGYKFEVIT